MLENGPDGAQLTDERFEHGLSSHPQCYGPGACEIDQAQGQHDFPAQGHKLVVARTGYGRAQQDEEADEKPFPAPRGFNMDFTYFLWVSSSVFSKFGVSST